MVRDSGGTPRAIWLLIVALAVLQPLIHLFIAFFPPEGTTPTGLHIPDSALFIESMDMFTSGFSSPYATCKASGGEQALAYYSVPHLWLYGGLGLLSRILPVDPFLLYGFANGVGALFFLWVVYRLLRTVVPKQANLAFVLFALGGGPGGVLFIVTGVMGLLAHPEFETYFFRFAVYDLMEGPHFNPVLFFPRLYYTLSLGACLGGLTAIIQMHRAAKSTPPWAWLCALFAGTFLDARYGVFTGALLILYLLCEKSKDKAVAIRTLAACGIPSGLGFIGAFLLMRSNPAVVENHLVVGSMAMWFSPFLIVCALPFACGMGPLRQRARESDIRLVRILIPMSLGYLLAYSVGYVLYQGYYGNLLTGRDGSVAAAISDWALSGALAGLFWAWRSSKALPAHAHRSSNQDWVILWFLGFAALSISGFGQGWFLRFGPQRLQILLWLPLCMLAAHGLHPMSPRIQRCLIATVVFLGICNIAVATLYFQSPFGRSHGEGPWPNLHAESMAVEDEQLIGSLGEGTVLAPAPASDVVVRLVRNPVVFGVGTFNLTDQSYLEVREAVDTFFAPETSDILRQEIVSSWCADWVYAPHTWPVSAQTRLALSEALWLEEIDLAGAGAIFRVRKVVVPE